MSLTKNKLLVGSQLSPKIRGAMHVEVDKKSRKKLSCQVREKEKETLHHGYGAAVGVSLSAHGTNSEEY